MDPRRFLLPAVGLLVLLAVGALVVTRPDHHSNQEVKAGSDGTTTTVEETTTTTSTTVVTTTTAFAAPTTTTTVRPTTTTAAVAAPARSWSISPTSGPSTSRFTASGSGCVGQGAGVALTMYDPNGQAFNGDGASSQPDGTWRLDTSLGAVSPGRYTIKAACQGSNAFEYPQVRAFTVT